MTCRSSFPSRIRKDRSYSKKCRDAYTEDGTCVESGAFSGVANREAIQQMTEFAEKEGFGRGTINFRLRDWLISPPALLGRTDSDGLL